MLSRGVIYVATGARFVDEATASRAQLRKTNPELQAAIVTDVADLKGDWQAIIPFAQPTHSLRDKLQMRLSPWECTLFLDTDTFVAAPLDLLFRLLEDGFDLIGHQLFEGHNYKLEDVPDAFPEFNTGVIGFRRSNAVTQFFDAWEMKYDRAFPAVKCDQRSFRQALYQSRLRHSVLTPEYNFRPLATNFAITDLRIVHGRPLAEMKPLKELVDVNLVHRAYVPRLGCVVSDFMTPRQAWRLWGAATFELIKTGSRPLRKRLRQIFVRENPKP